MSKRSALEDCRNIEKMSNRGAGVGDSSRLGLSSHLTAVQGCVIHKTVLNLEVSASASRDPITSSFSLQYSVDEGKE